MLPEPELTLVVRYLVSGGEIKEIPFGVSGFSWNFGKTARRSGSWGSFRRYGGLHIEAEALPHIAAGELTAAQARVGIIWRLLRRKGPLTAAQLGVVMRLSPRTTRASLLVLAQSGAVKQTNSAGPPQFATADQARPPHWTDYLPARAAAA